MADTWYTGNANEDADQHRGWLLGHFIDPANGMARQTEALEVKWGIHPAGQERPEWVADDQRTALLLLVSGRFRLDLSVGSVTLDPYFAGDSLRWCGSWSGVRGGAGALGVVCLSV